MASPTPHPPGHARVRRRARLVGALAVLLALACRRAPAGDSSTWKAARAGAPTRPTEVAYDGGLKAPWEDWGWAPREVKGSGPARVRMSDYGGWIVARRGLEKQAARWTALVFRYQAPPAFGDFLEVRLDSDSAAVHPRVKIEARHRLALEGGWVEVVVPMTELDPDGRAFDRIVLRAQKQVPGDWVSFDGIGLAGTGAATPNASGGAPSPAREVRMSVDCRAGGIPIQPEIYGIAFDPRRAAEDRWVWDLAPGGRRWGGNPASRFNWELGHAWNTANDWFFENVDFVGKDSWSWRDFLAEQRARKGPTALVVPMLGWVAKDTTSVAFPASTSGPQRRTDSYRPEAGDGFRPDGKAIPPGPPSRTSIAASPEWVGRWVQAIREADRAAGGPSVTEWILDNEPALWSSTHRDVHPAPVGYDELLEKTLAYGSAVRKADPTGVIAGPAEWGWPGWFFSAKDASVSFTLRPDRLAHGNVPLVPWYLRKLREHEQRTGTRILDVLDLHFYPQAAGVYGDDAGVDPETAALRIRSTRALWDPSYTDESWIKEPVRLIPRMKEWIADEYPGRGISIGEWAFGAEKHASGGLAVAEALGRFGQLGVSSAYYWTYPPEKSAAYWAFRAYRDFDGADGRFESRSVPATAPDGTSLFASRSEDGRRVVLVALNLGPERAVRATVDVASCGAVRSRRAFVYAGEASGLAEQKPGGVADATTVSQELPPWSIAVVELNFGPPGAP